MKENDIVPKLWTEKNFSEDIEYNIDHEIENRKKNIISYFENSNRSNILESDLAENNDFDVEMFINTKKRTLMEYELKLLKAYNIQKKIRREVVLNFVNEFDKHNTVFYTDILFHKTLLDRRFYKRQTQSISNKKENRLSDKFEQQLKIGIDFRKRDKHFEFLNNLMQHHKEFIEFHKAKKVSLMFLNYFPQIFELFKFN